MLTLFGLAWLRKAILRYAGRKALRDEDAAFAREVSALRAAENVQADRIGLVTAFKAVLIEGLGSRDHRRHVRRRVDGRARLVGRGCRGRGACSSSLIGLALKQPASRVPENTMKFVVGIMLTSFGTFWTGEGLGIAWWGADLSLLILAAFYLAVSAVLITAARAPRSVRA